MLRRSALTWTDGGAGFTLSDRAAFRVGGEESPAGSPRTPAPQHTHTPLLFSFRFPIVSSGTAAYSQIRRGVRF